MQPMLLSQHRVNVIRSRSLSPRQHSGARIRLACCFAAAICWPLAARPVSAQADDHPTEIAEIMPVDEVRPGMEGVGKTVLQGTEIIEFQAKVLGVLRGVGPGRDLVLCRLSGAELEYTGVIGGMSGSPVYIDGKLLGAVAYTWPFNKEPICGVTPFEHMRSLSDGPLAKPATIEATAEGTMPVALLDLARDPFAGLNQAAQRAALPVVTDAGRLTPIRMPLAASGFTQSSLAELRKHFAPLGLVPLATGGAGSDEQAPEPEQPIAPGAGMACSLVVGDFDLSAIGTVTRVEGERVWGWGHPFMSSGHCDYVFRSSYIHLVNPRQDISTKIGSARSVVGVVDSDVSTCVAGRIGAEPDLLPVTITVQNESKGPRREYRVQIVRNPTLLGPLVSTVLGNALEAGGALSPEITIELDAVIRSEGLEPILIRNTYSGHSVAGSQGARRLLNQLATIADSLARNPFSPVRLESIECNAVVTAERTSAAINRIQLNSDRFVPGDELVAQVRLRPYKCDPVEVEMRLQLPESIKPGTYTATVCDATYHIKQLFAEQPQLLTARSVEEIAQVFRMQLGEKRRTLYLRVVTPDGGLSVGEVTLPQLPSSAKAVFNSRRASPARPIRRALVERMSTDWVVEGSARLRFTVVKDKKVSG